MLELHYYKLLNISEAEKSYFSQHWPQNPYKKRDISQIRHQGCHDNSFQGCLKEQFVFSQVALLPWPQLETIPTPRKTALTPNGTPLIPGVIKG